MPRTQLLLHLAVTVDEKLDLRHAIIQHGQFDELLVKDLLPASDSNHECVRR